MYLLNGYGSQIDENDGYVISNGGLMTPDLFGTGKSNLFIPRHVNKQFQLAFHSVTDVYNCVASQYMSSYGKICTRVLRFLFHVFE